jgi:hypothetical protein
MPLQASGSANRKSKTRRMSPPPKTFPLIRRKPCRNIAFPAGSGRASVRNGVETPHGPFRNSRPIRLSLGVTPG